MKTTTTSMFMFAFSIVLLSCNNGGKEEKSQDDLKTTVANESKLLEINVFDNLDNRKAINLSKYASTISYVKLETRPDCLIKKIDRIELTPDFIFVSSFDKGLFQFSRSGRFLRMIGKQGNGPGEYNLLRDFIIDHKREKVYIFPNYVREMMVYDFQGTFLHKVDYDARLNGRYYGLVHGDYILVYTMDCQKKYTESESEEKMFNYYLIDLNCRIIKKFEREIIRDNNFGNFIIGAANFQPSEDHYILNEYLSNSVFSLDSNLEKKKIMSLYLGPWQAPVDLNLPSIGSEGGFAKAQKIFSEYVSSLAVNQISNSILISFERSNKEYQAVFDKELGQLVFCEEYGEGVPGGFKNDLDGGVPFWPEYVFGDSLMVKPIDAFELLDYFESQHVSAQKPESLTSLNGLTRDDNPVLIMASIN